VPVRLAALAGRSFMAEAIERVDAAMPAPRARSTRRRCAAAGDGLPRIAGHEHPCIGLHGPTDSLRLPCFHFAPGLAVLPAFGAFTGMHAVRRVPGDRVWAVLDDRVVEVPSR
jgi:hypothetical protein